MNDILGAELVELLNEKKEAGFYELEFNAAFTAGGLPSGIYFYQLKAGEFSAIKKLVLLK